jgi:non-ribosomal peptide synthetase component F
MQANSLQTWFESKAHRKPERIAVTAGSETLTYRQLDERANQLANHLRDVGVRPQSLVGLCLPHELDLMVALVAVLKAGGVYVPLDPKHPKDRLALGLADSGASVLITTREAAPEAPDYTTTVFVDRDAALIAAHPAYEFANDTRRAYAQ